MLRFSAHLSFLYLELPFAQRMEAAQSAGFAAIECAVPEVPATEMRARAQDLGLTVVGINTTPGEAEGERIGYAALPGREQAFARNLDAALDYAATAEAGHVHVLAGNIDGIARRDAEATFMRNMESAIRSAEKAGVRLVIEGLNSRDRPGYFVSRSQDAFAYAKRLGSPHFKVMFDTYHVQIMEGDILARLETHLPLIGHIQVSGVPGRSEPDSGELNHREIFAAIDRL
ncbi:MAG: TIM barrel protein, partial [Hyphomicrobiales bacterium]|nr:TIM barrel protein [Hyphomicrobiales bacterium]